MAQGDLRRRPPRSAISWITYDDIRPKLRDLDDRRVRRQPADGPVDVQRFVLEQLPRRPGRVLPTRSIRTRPAASSAASAPTPSAGTTTPRLMRKVQFIEAYNIGSSQAIIRSFNPHNAIPAVTSQFHQVGRR